MENSSSISYSTCPWTIANPCRIESYFTPIFDQTIRRQSSPYLIPVYEQQVATIMDTLSSIISFYATETTETSFITSTALTFKDLPFGTTGSPKVTVFQHARVNSWTRVDSENAMTTKMAQVMGLYPDDLKSIQDGVAKL
ncbi:hypothetical protein BC941DRAFT_468842 [Chlamydoabsidia padenii]|nr:hypothetical protein BC941DRAFT_468842 [Chlamydoabsidia padenii]